MTVCLGNVEEDRDLIIMTVCLRNVEGDRDPIKHDCMFGECGRR